MFSYLVIAAVLPALILANYPIVQCPGGLPSPRALRIQGCDASPCSVTRGSVIAFEADLTANENSASLTLEIDLTAFGETHPYPVPPALSNVCTQLQGAGCPVTAGQLLTQASGIPVIVDFGGGIPVTLRSRIYNQSGTVLSCSIINARIY